MNKISTLYSNCFSTKKEDIWLWHRRVAHINVNHLRKLYAKDLVIGLPKLNFKTDEVCVPCKKGKQTKNNFGTKIVMSTTNPLEMLHMDLFGPSQVKSFEGNYYGLVIVDDYSRFTWTLFLTFKSETYKAFKQFAKLIQNELSKKIVVIRTDHGGEFENNKFDDLCAKFGIEHQFSGPRTPHQI